MPCRSDHMEPNGREIESSKVLALLGEFDTKELDRNLFGNGSHEDVYNKSTQEQLDELTADLCSKLGSLYDEGIKSYSPEMQMWWRAHQKSDARREANEAVIKAETATKIYFISAIKIAEHRANYYAGVDGFKIGSSKWEEEVYSTARDNYDCIDWMQNNMDYSDWKEHIIKTEDKDLGEEPEIEEITMTTLS